MQKTDYSISLRIFAETKFIPLIPDVVERGAQAFGLGKRKALRLTMAAEEIVAHLVATAPGVEINLSLSAKNWCVLADFSFVANPSDLWAMNLAAQKNVCAGKSLDQLGLLLASHMADGFSIKLKGHTVHLELRQDRDYPLIEPKQISPPSLKGNLSIIDNPESALIKEACLQAVSLYPPYLIHSAFYTPGKFIDMVAQGDLNLAICEDEAGTLAGMITWRSRSEKSVSFSGPYIFANGDGVADTLDSHLFQTVSRTKSVILFSDVATNNLISMNYESLGQLNFMQTDNPDRMLNVWFRHLREDTGGVVWAHPTLRSFLEKEYDRLELMRTVREVDNSGEALPEKSVFSTRLRPDLKEANLLPMVVGEDVSESVKMNVDCLKNDGYQNIFFCLDSAYGWQAAMGKALLENSFEPKIILPHAGKSDVVVFQHV